MTRLFQIEIINKDREIIKQNQAHTKNSIIEINILEGINSRLGNRMAQ